MRITLNGETYETEAARTVADLLEELGLTGRRVAILMDDEVVRKATFGETELVADCSIEVVQMVGGG